jgi:adenylate cyclase
MNYTELQERIDRTNAEIETGNFEEALALITDVLTELDNPENPPHAERDSSELDVQFNAHFTHLILETKRGDRHAALRIAEHTLKFAELYLPQRLTAAWNQLGITHWLIGNFDKSLEFYSKVLADDEQNGRRGRLHAGTLVNTGIVYATIGSYDKALDYFEQALTLLTTLGETPFRANVLLAISDVYIKIGPIDKSTEYLAMALALYETLGYRSGIGRVMLALGQVYNSQGDYNQGLEHFGKALATFQELGETLSIATALGGIGETSRLMGMYSDALEHFGRALALHEELGNKEGIGIEFANLGIVYATHDFEGYDPAKAEEYLVRALAISKDLGIKHMTYEIHKPLAALYQREGRWQEAFEQYQLSITLRDEVQSIEAKKQSELMEQRRQAAEREKEVEIAKATAAAKLSATTNLLHKVLPESISTRMIEGEENIADFFPNVSILFADIAGFTPISADMPAFVVIRFLNHIFREFDRIIKKHGCEKIKTIGDGYMAVAGAPIECADHAERIMAAAFEMQETIQLPEEFGEYLPEGTSFGIRIGLHTGSVVAGVIGDERFVWDVYSDAVNTAARMESHGEADKIHVSHDFVRLLQNRFAATKNTTHGIQFVKRGEMEIKGKGMMKTYFLERLS